MVESWATSGVDLHLEPVGPGGLRRGLTDALRDAVRTGRLAPGTRLPSSRALAADLGIARNTVGEAYADLVAEGWLTARQGSGTRVAERTVVPPSDPARRPRVPPRPTHNLVPGTPDLAAFPRAEWARAARRALTAAPNDALGYGDPRGRVELRTALAGYLARVRGVRADPDNLVITAGFSHALRLLGPVLRARGADSVAVESYGLDAYWGLLQTAGLATPALPWDELGTDTGPLTTEGAVLLTPAHQFPMGMPLHPDRRAAVVDWARRTDSLVLEDDYDGEFRYDRQPVDPTPWQHRGDAALRQRLPVGALQALDPEHVVYMGTASKSLAPGLRLGWMVLPSSLVEECASAKGHSDTCGVLDQLTLAEFLNSGAYDRQVRRMRMRYQRRRNELVGVLAAQAPHLSVSGAAAGLHVLLELPPGTERSVIQAAVWQGLALKGLGDFRLPDAAGPVRDALVIGYGTPADSEWAGALDALLRVLP
ncbi:PLP-dependent aminotransferase family protein [Streptomyces murinus]|uniref:aminotransferase-like domain-containing protein n=1 Tax=Streptomyces murinus TaxID=33900 RepID=UPI002E160DE3|nr:PLP-dependent aminotransferase family protein [Streptomyces murinus]